jgi:hypothetical protein
MLGLETMAEMLVMAVMEAMAVMVVQIILMEETVETEGMGDKAEMAVSEDMAEKLWVGQFTLNRRACPKF